MLWYRWPPCLPAGLGAYRYALYGQIPYHASSTTGSLYAGRVPCIRPDTLPSRRWLSTVKGENGNQVEDSISITLYLTNSYGFSLDSFYPVTLMKQTATILVMIAIKMMYPKRFYVAKVFAYYVIIYSASINMENHAPDQ